MRLTRRDIEIIGYLSDQGVALSDQLIGRFFKSDVSFRVRISSLIKHGYIESVSIYQNRHLLRSRFKPLYEKLGFHPSERPNLKLFRLGPRFKGNTEHGSDIASPSFWQHQISLNELRFFLETVFEGGIFLSDTELRVEWSRFNGATQAPIPDLVYRQGEVELAFELERTAKSEVVYFERFSSYQRSDYNQVIYVAENETISARLRACAARFPKIVVTDIGRLKKGYRDLDGFTSIRSYSEIKR